jgi:hypothetical protein
MPRTPLKIVLTAVRTIRTSVEIIPTSVKVIRSDVKIVSTLVRMAPISVLPGVPVEVGGGPPGLDRFSYPLVSTKVGTIVELVSFGQRATAEVTAPFEALEGGAFRRVVSLLVQQRRDVSLHNFFSSLAGPAGIVSEARRSAQTGEGSPPAVPDLLETG